MCVLGRLGCMDHAKRAPKGEEVVALPWCVEFLALRDVEDVADDAVVVVRSCVGGGEEGGLVTSLVVWVGWLRGQARCIYGVRSAKRHNCETRSEYTAPPPLCDILPSLPEQQRAGVRVGLVGGLGLNILIQVFRTHRYVTCESGTQVHSRRGVQHTHTHTQ
jgi:hypothetical protein